MRAIMTPQFHRSAFQITSASALTPGEYEIVATAEHQLAEWNVATSLANQLEDE